ncbi:MAG: type II toxin-antitoxin system HicB family antitoxin [Candidatus Methanoperedens sp.]|nr:type II toxin-antitoxin system HicB family antitoxin [Candidatus Methanoperedens sp.]MCZ7369721.1 type II toxin-antitoxin system HicB family antitoxin [Candidatus Methanoperedens sp.]
MKIREIIKLLKADGMYRFLVVIEKANNNYSAYSPDLQGCVATGATREEAEKNMYEAIEMHIHGLMEDKLPIPESKSFAEYVAVAEKSSMEQTA